MGRLARRIDGEIDERTRSSRDRGDSISLGFEWRLGSRPRPNRLKQENMLPES